MLSLGPLAFSAPWVLAGLLALPLIWWLLRITPPAPKSVRFPAIRLLFGLTSERQTPRSSPLWLILLRLLAVTALILGLSGPLIGSGGSVGGSGPVLLIVDNGWASAVDWTRRVSAAEVIIDRAERENRAVAFLATARNEEGQPPQVVGPFNAATARARLSATRPLPWPVDRGGALAAVEAFSSSGTVPVYWLSDGLGDGDIAEFSARLQRLGSLDVLANPAVSLPKLLYPPGSELTRLVATVRRLSADDAETVKIQSRAADGRLLLEREATFAEGETEASATFELPLELRNEVARIELSDGRTAASVSLLDDRWQRKQVGIVSTQPADKGPALLAETFYIERALQPFSQIHKAAVSQLLKSDVSVMVIPDSEPVGADEQADLDRWIRRGGIALRFAGPTLAASERDSFTPVPLRRGGRTLGGTLDWSVPARLAAFPEASPFHGLAVPEDVRITRQVLAQPSLDLTTSTWASLTDGTPLMTAEAREVGWLILMHTTASADWSNLALSGLFVEMMRRVVWLGKRVDSGEKEFRSLPAFRTLDAFGDLQAPAAGTSPSVETRSLDQVVIGPNSPPGYYGSEDVRRAVNLAPRLGELEPLSSLPAGTARRSYDLISDVSFGPWLVFAALLLLLVDTIASAVLRGLVRSPRLPFARKATVGAAGMLLLALAVSPHAGDAEEAMSPEAFALAATERTRLAYFLTGIDEIDVVSRMGLTGLSDAVRRRTAAELGPPIPVNPARDELAFFPLLYWPVDDRQAILAPDTVRRLNRYLRNGGTIVFDSRDQQSTNSPVRLNALRRLANGLNIPPLVPVPPNHVLTKAFYLMQDFPGRWSSGPVWVEASENRANDGVSRVIVGGHDWAGAWSVDDHGRNVLPVVPGGEKQREMAYRFGVNLVMYALTGNYKADQVHVPSILERLGQ